MSEVLIENSLYTDAAGRAAIVGDKQTAMNALCFSLLGFLGCYQLAQNRSFLKTYETTEGKLQLNSIGDTNHDASLSVKLAVEAKAIPQPAAMNITKLLYKIKAKQIRGPLNEQLVRDIIKTMHISSNRPSSMVYNVVNQFEDGSIGLGQLAYKLYGLSKLPQFKAVSGEFRVLVMRGQYQELFAKLPKSSAAATVAPTPVASVAVTTPSVPVSTPTVAAPVAVNKKQLDGTGFIGMSDDELLPLYKLMCFTTDATLAVMRDKIIAWCKKAGVEIKVDSRSVMQLAAASMSKFMRARQEANDWNYLGFTPAATPKWMSQEMSTWSSSGGGPANRCGRALWLYAYVRLRDGELLAGRYKTFLEAMGRLNEFNGRRADAGSVADNNERFLEKVIRPDIFWVNYEHLDDISRVMNSVSTMIWAACNTAAGSAPIFPKLPMTLELWALLAKNADYRYTMTNLYGVFGMGTNNVDFAAILTKLLKLENSNINVVYRDRAFVVNTDVDHFKNLPEYEHLKLLKAKGLVDFVNTLDAFGTMTDAAIRESKNAKTENFWDRVASSAQRMFGNTDIIKSEKFVDWMIEQFKTGAFKPKLIDFGTSYYYSDNLDANVLQFNVMIELYSKHIVKPTFTDLVRFINFAIFSNVRNTITDSREQAERLLPEILKAVKTGDDIAQGIRVIRGAEHSGLTNAIVASVKAGDLNPKIFEPNTWKFLSMQVDDVDSIRILVKAMPDSVVEQMAALGRYVSTAINNRVWLDVIAEEKSVYRAVLFKKWMSDVDNKRPINALTDFLDSFGGRTVPEDLIPGNVKAKVLELVETFKGDNSILYNNIDHRDAKGGKIPAWIDKPLRAVLLDNTRNATNMGSVANADRLMTHKDFNEYLDKIPVNRIPVTMRVSNYADGIAFSAILEKIARNPSDYNVNTMLKIAYAMHDNYKGMASSGIPERNRMIDKGQMESAYNNLCEALNTLIGAGKYDEVNKMFDSLSFAPDLKAKILDWFRKSALLKNSLNSVKNDDIHALVDIDPKRMNQLMRFNNIKFPTGLRVTKDNKLSDIAKMAGSFDLEPLKTTDENLDEKALDRRTAEYDVFNKYRHGNIGVKFLRSFNVAIPSQIEANKIWDEAHADAERMDPVFHGTGSVAATFVLRYGFAVISASDASVVGRMLGNGIYFSNVLDKCGQYVSDAGYSRGIGKKGYVLQMKANLGTKDVDYKTQSGGLVSPEWCVFHPNDQLNIYKAHFVELVDKSQIDEIKNRVGLNEEFFPIEQFKQHLNEDAQNPVNKGCVSYTFLDGTIPITDNMAIDFEQFDPTEYGPHVTLSPSGLGPVVYIQVDDPTINEIYAIRYTVRFMNRGADLKRFQDLLAKRPVEPLNTQTQNAENVE